MALEEQEEKFQLEILDDSDDRVRRFIHENRTGAREPEPCVIVLDWHLPRHNGLDILLAIREAPALTHIKVMVLTGFASPREQAEIQALGAFYRHKPAELSGFPLLAREIITLCRSAVTVAS
jgi:DNA-binding response OmpR family regulator